MRDFEVMVASCTEWLRLQKKRKTINPKFTTYGMKHEVEEYFSPACARSQAEYHDYYVSEKAFIEAAIRCGYTLRYNWNKTHARLNISSKRVATARHVVNTLRKLYPLERIRALIDAPNPWFKV